MIPPVTINLFQPQAVTRPPKQLIGTQEIFKHPVEAEEEILFKEVTAEKEVSCKYGKIEAIDTIFFAQVSANDGLVLKNVKASSAIAKLGTICWENAKEKPAVAFQIQARNLIDLQNISADQVTSHHGSVKAVHGVFGSILAEDEAILTNCQATSLKAVNKVQSTHVSATKVTCSQGSLQAQSSLLQEAYAKTDSILHNCDVLTCTIEKGSLQFTRDLENLTPCQFLQARDSLVLQNVRTAKAETLGPAQIASCQMSLLVAADKARLIDCQIHSFVFLIDPEKGGELRLERNCQIHEIIIQKKTPAQKLYKPECEEAETNSASLQPKTFKIYTEKEDLNIRFIGYKGLVQICPLNELA